MTDQEAILRIEDHIEVHKIGTPPHIQVGEALTVALDALKERIVRSNNFPLTLDELKLRCGKPIFYRDARGCSGWSILNDIEEITTRDKKTVVLHCSGDIAGGHEYKENDGTNFYDRDVLEYASI